MKKLLPYGQIVIAVALIVLYVLHFQGKEKTTIHPKSEKKSLVTVEGDELSRLIYYINIDTVLTHYHFYTDQMDLLERKLKASEADLTSKGQQFQKEVADYQSKMQKGLLLRSEAQQIEQQLAATEQQLLRFQEATRNELAQEQVVSNRKVIDEIMKYLEAIQPEYNYRFVLGTTFGGGVLYASTDLDITREVIDGLNEKYQKAKEKESKK